MTYKTVGQELYERGLIEGFIKTVFKERILVVQKLITMGVLTDKQIASVTGINSEDFAKLKREFNREGE